MILKLIREDKMPKHKKNADQPITYAVTRLLDKQPATGFPPIDAQWKIDKERRLPYYGLRLSEALKASNIQDDELILNAWLNPLHQESTHTHEGPAATVSPIHSAHELDKRKVAPSFLRSTKPTCSQSADLKLDQDSPRPR